MGTTIIGATVAKIIWRNHRIHDDIKLAQTQLVDQLNAGLQRRLALPQAVVDRRVRSSGVYYTLLLLALTAVGTDAFCFAMYLSEGSQCARDLKVGSDLVRTP